MAILDNIDTLFKWGSKAAALKDTAIRKSIAASAQDAIFQYPCLISNNAPVNMATTVNKYIERICADFTMMAISQVANVDMTLYRTPGQFLKHMQTNMRVEAVENLEDDHMIQRALYEGEFVVAMNESAGVAIAFETAGPLESRKLYALNLEQTREFLSDFDVVSFLEAEVTDREINNSDILQGMVQAGQLRNSNNMQKLRADISKNGNTPSLMDRDVKKSNDLQPYAVQVRLNVINDKNEFVQYWDIVVGVKSVLHLIKSEEMIENVGRALQNRSAFNSLIKWTTGEISLVKDIMLHINDVKLDMRNMSNGYSSWFPTLKRMKDRKVTISGGRVNQVLPTTTLVLTSYEVDEIEKRYGIYIKDLPTARRLMSNLFLMGFVILDEASMTIDVLWDKSKAGFETYALETLQREVALNSNRLANEIGRMISH